MQGRYPEGEIILTEKENVILQKIEKSKTAEIRLVQRARTILLASEGKYRNTEIGEQVGLNRDSVRKWRKRFLELGLEGLKDEPRSGHPLKFDAHERTQILTMATKSPEKEGRHFTDWSTRSLADHVTKKGIVKSINHVTIHRMLKNADIKPHKWAYWLNSNDPDFLKKRK